MKQLIMLFASVTLVTVAGIAQARDLGPDEALRLRDAGTIQSFERLNELAIAKHPGAIVEDTDLEKNAGRYVYEVELRDPLDVKWDMKLDAVSGEVLQDQQED